MQAGAVQIRLVADIMDLQSKMQKAQSIVDNAAGSISKALGAAFAGFSAASFVTKLIDVQRQFDVLNSSLITVTGSSTKAAQEFAWIKQFAATTPYQLNEVTSAFVKMKALGLDASQKALTSYGNTASAMGKGMNQMVEAVADAATGEFERLKEFGIKAKKEGDQVSLTFQGVTKTIGSNAAEITKYLQDIGNNEFGSAMTTRAATLDGAISNLADSWDALYLSVSSGAVGGLIYDGVTMASEAIKSAEGAVKSVTEAIIPAIKVATAYFAIFVAAPAIYTMATAALTSLIHATAMHAYNMITGEAATIGLNTSLYGTSVAAQLATGSLSKMALAGSVLFAAFAGWQFGTYLRDQFVQVRVAGLAFIGAMMSGWEHLVYGTKLAGAALKALLPGTESFADAKARLSAEHAKEIDLIDQNIVELIQYETTVKSVTAAEAASVPTKKAVTAATKEQIAAAKKAIEEATKGLAKYNELMDKSAGFDKSWADTARQLRAALDGKKISQEQYNAAILEAYKNQPIMVAAEKAAIDAAKLNTDAVDELFDAQEKLRQANEDQIKTGRTMLEQIEFETRLLGLNAEQRAVATMERELESQGIVKGTQAYDAYIIKLREAMALKSAKEAGIESTKELADANKKAAEKSSKYWEDALMRAFESGKGFFESLWDTIKNTLKTQVLKVLVTGVIGGTSGIASAATGANVLTSAAGSLASGVSGIGTGIMNGIGTFAAANLGVGGLALQGTLATIAEQGLISGFTSAMTSASTLAGAGSFAGAIGAAAPYLLPAIALLSMVGNKRAPSAGTGEGNIQYDAAGNAVSQSSRFTGAWGLTDDVVQSIGGLSAAYMASAASLGIGTVAAQFGYGGNTGKEGKDPQFAIGVNAGGAAYNSGEMQLNEANVQLAASRAVFAALQGSDLPKYLEGVFDSLTASTATQEQISATMAYAAQLKAVRDSLTETREPLQILQDQVTAGTAALATSAATFKTDFVAAIDAGMNATKLAQWQALGGALDQLATSAAETAAAAEAAAQKMAEAAARLQAEIDSAQFDAMSAYMSAQADYAALVAQEQDAAAQAMEQAAAASAQAAEAIRSAMASAGQGIAALIRDLTTTAGGTLDPMALMRSTQRAYLDDLRLAQAGDVQASGRVAGSARAYLDASGAVSANNRQAATVAQVVAELGKLPAVKTYEQQLLEAVQGTTTAVNTSSATNAATIAAALATKLTAQLSVDANSQIFKLISFLATTDDIPAELKDLALKAATEAQRTINLVTSTTLLTEAEKQAILAITTTGTKNISLALANDAITEQFQTAVLAATISTTKNVGLVAAYASAADRQTIIGASESVTKLVSAALANTDPAAMAIALAQSSVLERMLKASGGVLTDDQRALIDGIATYNKTIVFNAVVDSAAMQAVKAAYEKLAADVAKTGVTAGAGTTITVGNTTTTTTGTVSPGMTPEQIAAAAQATLYTRIRDLYDSIDKTVVASKTDAYTQTWGAIELAKQLKSVGATMRDVASARSQSYESVLAGFAAFGILPFDQGTNYLPYDQVAMVHKGERIIPAADNRELMQRLQSPQENSAALVAEIARLRESNERLERRMAGMEAAARSSAASNANTADSLRTIVRDGLEAYTDPNNPPVVRIVTDAASPPVVSVAP